jgi:hypothetical protein
MRAVVAVLLGTVWVLAAAPVPAHHSFAAEFDVARPLTLTGSITKIEWTNPHAWLYIEVKDDEGNVRPWAMELSPSIYSTDCRPASPAPMTLTCRPSTTS